MPTAEVAHLTRSLAEADRPLLARLGLRFGVETIYMPEMLKPAQIALRSLLYALAHGVFFDGAPPPAGRVAVDAIADVPDDYWLAVGYRRLGAKVMRVDMVERVAMLVRTAARAGQFRISDDMLSLAGATREQMGQMLLDLGCVVVGEDPVEDPEKPAVEIFERKRRQKLGPRGGKPGGPQRSEGWITLRQEEITPPRTKEQMPRGPMAREQKLGEQMAKPGVRAGRGGSQWINSLIPIRHLRCWRRLGPNSE